VIASESQTPPICDKEIAIIKSMYVWDLTGLLPSFNIQEFSTEVKTVKEYIVRRFVVYSYIII